MAWNVAANLFRLFVLVCGVYKTCAARTDTESIKGLLYIVISCVI